MTTPDAGGKARRAVHRERLFSRAVASFGQRRVAALVAEVHQRTPQPDRYARPRSKPLVTRTRTRWREVDTVGDRALAGDGRAVHRRRVPSSSVPGRPGPPPCPGAPGLRPYWSVKSTWRVDSHLWPPAIHTGPAAYPLVWQRLAARPPGRPWHTGGSGRGGSDPPRRGLGTGSGRGGNSHLAPRPPRVAPAPSVPGGKARRAPLRGAGPHTRRPLDRRSGGRPRPGSTRRTTRRSNATGRSIRFCTTLNPTFRFRRFGVDGPIHSQPGIRPSR